MAYECYARHREDVTAAVKSFVNAAPGRVARASKPNGAAGTWKVCVTCSEGHENIFEGDGDVFPGGVGRQPSAAERALNAGIAQLSPIASLERIDAFAKYLIGIVSTVGVILTGFGVWSPIPAHGWKFVLIPVGLVALSVVCAIRAITPRLEGFNTSDLNQVRAQSEKLVTARTGLVAASGVLFVLAVIAAPIAVFPGRLSGDVQTQVVLNATAAADKVIITGNATVSGLTAADLVTIHVHAKPDQKLLFIERGYSDQTGRRTTTFSIDVKPSTFADFVATVLVGHSTLRTVEIASPKVEESR